MLHLLEGTLLFVSAASEGQDRSADSRRHHQGRLEADRPAIGFDDQLTPVAELPFGTGIALQPSFGRYFNTQLERQFARSPPFPRRQEEFCTWLRNLPRRRPWRKIRVTPRLCRATNQACVPCRSTNSTRPSLIFRRSSPDQARNWLIGLTFISAPVISIWNGLRPHNSRRRKSTSTTQSR